jgi:hypothetical protein
MLDRTRIRVGYHHRWVDLQHPTSVGLPARIAFTVHTTFYKRPDAPTPWELKSLHTWTSSELSIFADLSVRGFKADQIARALGRPVSDIVVQARNWAVTVRI